MRPPIRSARRATATSSATIRASRASSSRTTGDNRGYGPEHDLARENIFAELESYGLSVVLEPFQYNSVTYYNVVATMPGTTNPDQEYILGAHMDSVDNPGADDNASGTALMLQAASILSQYPSDYTIRFIAFDREEQGLIGSYAYVNAHSGDDILGMLSTDMVAYNTGANSADIFAGSGSVQLQVAVAAAVAEYGQGLSYVQNGLSGGSDHRPFEQAGYQACLFIEDWGNPNYHTQRDSVDTPNYIDYAYAVRMSRTIVGFLVDAAGVQVPIDALEFTFPNGTPEFVAPGGGTRMRVEVSGRGNAVPQPGTGVLHVEIGGGWQSIDMEPIADNVYDAVFPAAVCGSVCLYYVSAETLEGEIYTDPRNAPDATYAATVAKGLIVGFHDNFETDQGWTAVNLGATSGDWQRGVPINDPRWAYAPISDSDGSGKCFVTENENNPSYPDPWNTDVDGGAVRLFSPILDMTAAGDISYDYFLRLTQAAQNTDHLIVEIDSHAGGGPWTEIARHSDNRGLAWTHHIITQAELEAAGVELTDQMQLRFTANDAESQSIVEAGLDAFMISTLDCFDIGDVNCDGVIDTLDIEPFLVALFDPQGYEALYPDCDITLADIDGNGIIDALDIEPFLWLLFGP